MQSETLLTLWRRRTIGVPAWALLAQLFIGIGWMRAAVEKLIDPAWWSTGQISEFISDHSNETLAWYRPFLDDLIEPNLPLVSVVVVLAQLFAAAGLLTGYRQGTALGVGLFLNLNFIAIGAVDPSAFYVVIQLGLVLWMAERNRHRADVRQALGWAQLSAFFVAGISLPSISTLHPAEVITDPALMFITLAGLLAASSLSIVDRTLASEDRQVSTSSPVAAQSSPPRARVDQFG